MKTKIFFIMIFTILIIFFNVTKSKAVTIPKVFFAGDLTNMTTKKDERKINIKFESEDLKFEKYAKIKVQGSSSLAYDKKNYTINLYDDEELNKKSKIDMKKGWGEQSKYNLKANWIDKTQSRNIVSARIAGKVQRKYGVLNDLPNNGSIDGFPVEVYINNEFLGLYTWNIPKDAWMWNIDENNQEHIVLEGTWYTEYVNFKKKLDGFDGTGWEVEVGNANEKTVNNFNRLVGFINDSSDDEFKRDFDLYLNKDATINYLLMIYLIEGIDNTGKNMMLVSYDNGQIWYPCLYDLDSTWGTFTDGTLNESYSILPENEIANHSTNNLITRMIKCFPDEISAKWFELRKDIFSKEKIMNEFNIFMKSIPEETYKKEAEKWRNAPGYDIKQIEEFVDFRLEYVDKIMNERFTVDKNSAIRFCPKSR